MLIRAYLAAAILLSTALITPQVQAYPHDRDRGGYGRGPNRWHSPAIIVHEGYHHPRPRHISPYYYGYNLPTGVALAVLAGVTYAVVDGMYYYRQAGDRYVYVERPPAGSYSVVEAPTPSSSSALGPGAIISNLPVSAKKVEYKNQTYYVVGENWFLKVAGDHDSGYVVVKNPLL